MAAPRRLWKPGPPPGPSVSLRPPESVPRPAAAAGRGGRGHWCRRGRGRRMAPIAGRLRSGHRAAARAARPRRADAWMCATEFGPGRAGERLPDQASRPPARLGAVSGGPSPRPAPPGEAAVGAESSDWPHRPRGAGGSLSWLNTSTLYNFGVLTKRYELVSRTAGQFAPGVARRRLVGFLMILAAPSPAVALRSGVGGLLVRPRDESPSAGTGAPRCAP